MGVIVSLRGTSGAGKSTVVHEAIKRWGKDILETMFGKNRPLVYIIHAPNPFLVFGAYETQCGGCDTITDYKNIIPQLLDKYSTDYNILFEGLLLSGGYGSVGRALTKKEEEGHKVVFAFMNTPLEVCLERVSARRLARGKTEPLNPKNTAHKYKEMWASKDKIENMNHTCVVIDHEKAFQQVMKLLGNTVRKAKP